MVWLEHVLGQYRTSHSTSVGKGQRSRAFGARQHWYTSRGCCATRTGDMALRVLGLWTYAVGHAEQGPDPVLALKVPGSRTIAASVPDFA
eukprot:3229170-Rhodomonas_salina.2